MRPVLLALTVLLTLPLAATAGPSEDVALALRTRLETPSEGGFTVGGAMLYSTEALPRFYLERLYQPAWPPAGAKARELVNVLRKSDSEGLRPADYHLERIEALLPRAATVGASPELLAELDLLLTDAFLIYGAHLVSGRIDPESLDPEWVAVRREVDLVALLGRALEEQGPRLVLEELLPQDPGYDRLRDALARYRDMPEWGRIPEGEARIEDGDPRIPALRARLRATGDLAADAPEDTVEVFDEALDEAVRAFQRRHGLGDDGVVGAKTLAALNVSAKQRARQIELNLERWRWLPRDLGPRHVLVDIPAFTLQVLEDGAPVLEMRTVVGRSYRRTPVMSDRIRYLVLNPFWEVPPTLAVQDKLPEIRKDPEYLVRNGFHLLEGWGSEEREVDPSTVDWKNLPPRRFPYRLRQDPGPLNALGKVKFMFPNRFNVYVHDTPTRELFRSPERAASSGCVRVEKPLDLAEYLLRGAPGWDRKAIDAAIDRREPRTVQLPEAVPIHIQYWTATVAEDGTVVFRTDVYGRDTALQAALALPAPDEPE